MLSYRPRILLACAAAVLLLPNLAACDNLKPSPAHALDMSFYDYSSDIRWGDFEAAYSFVDPATRTEHPMTDLDRARFKQIEVSSYNVLTRVDGKGTVDQKVQIGIINRNTQVPRNVIAQEHWRWDTEHKRWWLVSGLPDITAED